MDGPIHDSHHLLLNNLISALQITLKESKTPELDFLLIMESHMGEILECFPEYPEGIRDKIEVLYDEYLGLKKGPDERIKGNWRAMVKDLGSSLENL